ncbi:acyl-CoA--sterol O-acyltransferase 1-like isoform X3 [Andrographis paniculata]|uniref:acyl-CoA--sterol O-acyltransferase 1-like isoform X3 n=1 Tax=Andrographis paniculata TaxID=175694 RepID=UPI0021E922CA|nr:acyl-CoA--sterol O-acyltransferase 1-like isoform X3 [Andrographis paniculata]
MNSGPGPGPGPKNGAPVTSKLIPKGGTRLAAFLPVAGLFAVVPLHFNSLFLCSITILFITWLSTFKVLMLAFDNGPLYYPSQHSLFKFLAVGCLPVEFKSRDGNERCRTKGTNSFAKNGFKVALLAMLLAGCGYGDRMDPKVVLTMYFLVIYFSLEILLAVGAATWRGLVGVELEPVLNEPYLSASLQEFWGRRWNLIMARMFHSAVYVPTRDFSAAIVGRRWAAQPAAVVTFGVSGLMHELSFFYFGCVEPRWEVTRFFLLHGVCVAVEIGVKKELKLRRRFPAVAGVVLTHGFLLATAFWLFFPQFLWCICKHRGVGSDCLERSVFVRFF